VGASGARENDGSDQKDSYQGSGGISLSSLATRLTFAVKYAQPNFILNDVVSAKGAKIMFDRDPRQRVLKVAPFLQVDGDPYPAIVGGHIVWMLDGYTTMSNYPYSERESFGQATADTFSAANKTASQPNSQINYIRNSVKATVDAYTGQVTLYAWDETDPVLKTWEKVFPGIIQPRSAMSTELLSHVRYPQDLFEVQRSVLARYHVTNPVTFYNVGDQWTVPDDPTVAGGVDQPPYYLLSGADAGTGTSEYQLTSPMQVNGRPQMAAYISVNSEGNSPDYGKMSVLRLPSGSSILGPGQIFSQFNSDTTISRDITLLSGSGSTVLHGNLLTIPIGKTFLYVEPLYVKGSSGNSFPLLRRVLVSYGETGKPGYADSLSDALINLTQPTVGFNLDTTAGTGTTPTTTPSTTATPTSSPTTTAPSSGAGSGTAAAVLGQVNQAFTALQNAYKTGNFATIGAAQEKLKDLVTQYQGLVSAKPTPTPSPSKS
jgi:uncharacterized protein